MKLDPNAPAFPVPGIPPVSTGDPRDGMGYGTDPQPGITIRGHLAGLAMQGLLANSPTGRSDHHYIVTNSIELADALIARLNETPADVTPVEAKPKCAIAHDAENAPQFRTAGGFCLVCGQDWPVSPPALPPGIPEPPPEGVGLFGRGPLKEVATGDEYTDVYLWNSVAGKWFSGNNGDSETGIYALRRGTPIARANGIPD